MDTKILFFHGNNGEITVEDANRQGQPGGSVERIANATAVIRVSTRLESISVDVIKCRPGIKLNFPRGESE